jgi:hypothetical protein
MILHRQDFCHSNISGTNKLEEQYQCEMGMIGRGLEAYVVAVPAIVGKEGKDPQTKARKRKELNK